ncbi:MAG: ferritin family protein [Sedimentisphaerales bacterium]|nr:ferritin family protein [Sedimentisphaerales bacterium]
MSDVPDFAISEESKSAELYTKMAATAENPWMRKTLEDFAQQERQHHEKLKAVRAGRNALVREEIDGLGIAEKLDDVEPHPDMDYPELLVFAIKKENASQGLYTRLASIFTEPEFQETFLSLVEQEAKHKRQFEMEYELLTS